MINQIIELNKQERMSDSMLANDDETRSESNLTHVTMQTNDLGLNINSQYLIVDVSITECKESLKIPAEEDEKWLHEAMGETAWDDISGEFLSGIAHLLHSMSPLAFSHPKASNPATRFCLRARLATRVNCL